MNDEIAQYYETLEALDTGNFTVSKWEADFLAGLLDERPGWLSPKQRDVIDRMADKYLHD